MQLPDPHQMLADAMGVDRLEAKVTFYKWLYTDETPEGYTREAWEQMVKEPMRLIIMIVASRRKQEQRRAMH